MTLKRRNFIQKVAASLPLLSLNKSFANESAMESNSNVSNHSDVTFNKKFNKTNNRVWVGENFWSIPLENWRIHNGKLESDGLEKNSRVNVLAVKIKEGDGECVLKCKVGLSKGDNQNATLGFTIGLQDTTDPESVSAACYFGNGVRVGLSLKNQLFIDDKIENLTSNIDLKNMSFEVKIISKNGISTLSFQVKDNKGHKGTITKTIEGDISGLISLNQFERGASFWWDAIDFKGSKIGETKNETFGPILWCMYTLSAQTLKLTAQLPPVSLDDSQEVYLEFKKEGAWQKVQTAKIDAASYSAVFRIENYSEKDDLPYRAVFEVDGGVHYYTGTIRKEPKAESLKLGALTCQHAMGFPYRPLVENIEKTNPDMLYFSGDQIYEENGGYRIIREPEEKAILSYLGKYYMFGWAFGNVMKDRPTVCTPDDHDVFQGNLWGEGGRLLTMDQWESQRDAQGGMVQSAKMINVVNRTQCAHLPDPFHPQLLPSGITTWYTQLHYGGVSFAIVSDRMFKSGPEMIRKGEGRIDHVTVRLKQDELESENLSLMGNPQMEFLENWAQDWQNVNMKVLLSQTLFANVATHHGPKKEFLFGDLDSGGWPKKQRDEVLRLMQKAAVFHINGDQHLPFLVQYSIDEKRDGGWTFCTPAVSTGYPRWAKPDAVNMPFTDRPTHGLEQTGIYRDIFGNDNYVYAVGNPEEEFDQEKNRYVRAQKKASGFGLITFDTEKRSIKMEAIRFLANLSKDVPESTYPGWPFSITQMDNDGRRALGYLPKIVTSKANQVIRVFNQETGALVSAMRINGNTHKPTVFENAVYKISVGEGSTLKHIENLEISQNPEEEIRI